MKLRQRGDPHAKLARTWRELAQTQHPLPGRASRYAREGSVSSGCASTNLWVAHAHARTNLGRAAEWDQEIAFREQRCTDTRRQQESERERERQGEREREREREREKETERDR